MIKNHLIIDFSKPPERVYPVLVDAEATFLKVIVSPEGVAAFYNVPRDSRGDIRTDNFMVIVGSAEPPNGYDFEDVLSTIIEDLDEQGRPRQKLVIFPIFRQAGEIPF